MDDRYIYILLTDTGTLLARTIKKYTEAPYNHVSIAFDEHLDEMYSFGRKVAWNPFYAGFVKEDVYRGTYSLFPKTKCVLFKLKVTQKQYIKLKKIITTFQIQEHLYTYNLIGLFGIITNHPIERKYAYFCSQFVSHVLKQSGIVLWDKHPALVTPIDFLTHQCFTRVYEGTLRDYPLLSNEEFSSRSELLRESLLTMFKM